MANPSKQRGTAFESGVVAFLQGHGFPTAERRALSGVLDKGDVAGIPGVVIECKAGKAIDLSGWSDETERERINAGASVGLLVVKRRMKPIAASYAVMSLEQAARLLADEA